jgi:FkbM family methyltransferase
MGNISFYDKVRGRVYALSYLIFIKPAIRNWYDLVLFKLGVLKQMTLVLKSGEEYTVMNDEDLFNFLHIDKPWTKELARFYRFPIRVDNDKVVAMLLDKEVVFSYKSRPIMGTTIGLLMDLMNKDEYSKANVNGRDVVDIGATIGDSAIYFVLKGAKHVYAFEPYPYSYNAARKNIRSNKFEDKITLFNAGIGGHDSKTRIEGSLISGVESSLADDAGDAGKVVPVLSLKSVADKCGVKNGVLKIDCEGCEVNAIMNSSNEVLRRFDQIVMEYHYGYRILEDKLKGAGFKVSHTAPKYFGYNNIKHPDMYIGMIYAYRKDLEN